MVTLALEWLGPPRVTVDGRPVRLETRKVSALLAILSVDRRPQSRDHLAALFWPEFDSRRAPANLRRALTSLQASLGTGWLQANRETIELGGTGQLRVDTAELLVGVRDARAHHPKQEDRLCASCAGKLEEAARLHRGGFLEGLNLSDCPDFDRWQAEKREAFSHELGWALERLAEWSGEAGRWEEAIGLGRRWLSLDELHEPAHRALMSLYARSGKRSAALRQYEECARLLRGEIGQEPDDATRALAERIRLRTLEPAHAEPAQPADTSPTLPRSPIALPTRLRPPPVRPRLVPRSRLHALLDEGVRHPLTLVSAPAGFGKSTLLADWAASRDIAAAWLSVEEGDNDPAHLLGGMASALGTLDPATGAEALQMLHSLQVPPLSAVMDSLLRDLAKNPEPRVVVLDDVHLVTRPEAQKLLADFAGHLPPECHLVIATRMDPAFPLARLRARAQIVEVRADDLRFLPEEAAAFLRQVMELDLGEQDIALLGERTEGWAAGLQMAALSLRNRRDPSAFIRSFGGSHRHVVDYLVAEVMDGQSAERQEFLLSTSVLERFCAGLCDELLRRPGSQVMLEELDRANLFLVPLDGERTWYRYHHLFAELLRHRLRQGRPSAEIEDLHGRAARWLEGNGDPEDAMWHFLAGRKHEEAIRLMDRCHEAILTRGGLVTLQRWAQQLPAEKVGRSPEACVTLGTVYVWAGKPEDAEKHFAQADVLLAREAESDSSSRVRSLRARAAIMRAYVAEVTGATSRAIELAREGEALLPPDTHSNHRSLIPYILCRAYRYKGELEQSKASARVMIGMARATGNAWGVATAVHELIWLCRHQGRLREADRELEAFDAFPREAGSAGPIAKLTASRGELQRERGDLEAAARTILAAQEDVRRWALPSDIYFCCLLRIRLALSQGDPAAAAEELRRADEVARGALVFASMSPLLEAERARVFLAKGMIEEAVAWMEGCPVPAETNQMNHEVVLIARARVLIAAGRSVEASKLLDRLAAVAEAGGRYGRLLEILVLRTAAGAGEAADSALRRALEIAEPEGYVRIFLDEGEPVANRIREILDRPDALVLRLADYARRLMSVATT